MLWIAAAVTVGFAIWATRRYRENIDAQPKGLSHIFEILMNFIREDIVNPNIGVSYGKMWAPLITTYFIFILITFLLIGLLLVSLFSLSFYKLLYILFIFF